MSRLTSIFNKHFKRFKSELVLSPILKVELLSIIINCTECISCLVERFKIQHQLICILEPLYANNLLFVGLIAI